MKNIVRGSDWIRIDDDRINIRAITRYQVVGNELKIYLLSAEIFRIPLESENSKLHVLSMLDEMCQLAAGAQS